MIMVSLISTSMEDWLGLDADPIVGSSFERSSFV